MDIYNTETATEITITPCKQRLFITLKSSWFCTKPAMNHKYDGSQCNKLRPSGPRIWQEIRSNSSLPTGSALKTLSSATTSHPSLNLHPFFSSSPRTQDSILSFKYRLTVGSKLILYNSFNT